jgi:hypothetical protein
MSCVGQFNVHPCYDKEKCSQGEKIMRHLGFFIAIFVLCMSGVGAQENMLLSDDPPYPCPFTNGAFYQAGVFPRYEVETRQLVLVDMATNQAVHPLDTIEQNVRIINWSPDCHYLTGAVGTIDTMFPDREWPNGQDYVSWLDRTKDIVFWDAVNGKRIHTIKDSRGEYLSYLLSPIIWNPRGDRALVLGGCPSVRSDCIHERIREDYMWRADTNASFRVGRWSDNQRYFFSRSWFNQLYWDEARGWLWGSGATGVSAYDVDTGVEVAFFDNQGIWSESRFVF